MVAPLRYARAPLNTHTPIKPTLHASVIQAEGSHAGAEPNPLTAIVVRDLVWGWLVLRTPTDKVRYCYRRAAEARERALRAADVSVKAMWFKVEDQWIGLAHSWAMAEAFADFGTEVRKAITRYSERH